jgi:hypothetical protein
MAFISSGGVSQSLPGSNKVLHHFVKTSKRWLTFLTFLAETFTIHQCLFSAVGAPTAVGTPVRRFCRFDLVAAAAAA